MDNDNGNGAGNHADETIVLELSFDPRTYQVAIGGTAMPISLAQMICGEALRVLEESRRIAALQILQRNAAEQVRSQEIARSVLGRRQ